LYVWQILSMLSPSNNNAGKRRESDNGFLKNF